MGPAMEGTDFSVSLKTGRLSAECYLINQTLNLILALKMRF